MQEWLKLAVEFVIDNAKDEEFSNIRMKTGLREGIFSVVIEDLESEKSLTFAIIDEGESIHTMINKTGY